MKLIKKYLHGNPMAYSSYVSGDTRKAINEGTKKVASAFNTAMGWLGEMLTGPISGMAVPAGTASGAWSYSQSPQYVRNVTTLQPAAKKLIEENAVYVSPSSHVAAWTQGSLDPKVGAQVLASDSRLQALGIVGDLATLKYGPKVIKGAPKAVVKAAAKTGNKTAKKIIVALEINKAVKNTSPKVSLPINTEISFINNTPSKSRTSLAFFERKPSRIGASEKAGIPRGERFVRPFRVAAYPGYLLKGLMKGSLLEKQLSKNGTISVNLLNAYFNKASQIEKEIANKVLTEKFSGQKTIDYNLFKKAVLDELIGKYNRVPLTNYADYGLDRLGMHAGKPLTIDDMLIKTHPKFSEKYDIMSGDEGPIFFEKTNSLKGPVSEKEVLLWIDQNLNSPHLKTNTFTFESPRIPIGNNKHYDTTTLGHSRTYTTPDEPNVLHVMESLSDWAQKSLGLTKAEKTAILNIDEQLKTGTPTGFSTLEELEVQKQAILDRASLRTRGISYQAQHLHDNYLQRQLQENLRYAAENGQTKMRYPTSETAAKIEGYLSKIGWFTPEGKELNPLTSVLYNLKTGNFEAPIGTIIKLVYDPKHQTILNKYADFPKLFLKLFKDLQVRTVTDTKGNTWHEIDVPKGYLNREWLFKQGGILKFLQ